MKLQQNPSNEFVETLTLNFFPTSVSYSAIISSPYNYTFMDGNSRMKFKYFRLVLLSETGIIIR
uniref:Uncharacterized protein n=1 Tax=Onchocerca volvulus TaxID=6282 RepID=A0A8R1TS27_ONCVO